MGWLSAIFNGILTAICAAVSAGLVALGCVDWYRVSSREGASGFFVVGVGLAGAMAGMVLGVVVSRVVAAGPAPAFWKAAAASCGIAVGLCGVTALAAWALADIAPEWDGESLDLRVELRLPAGDTDPAGLPAEKTFFTLGSVDPSTHVQRDSWRGEWRLAERRLEQGRWIVPGVVAILSARGDRTLDATFGGEKRGAFYLPLRGKPDRRFEHWSDWLPRARPDGSPWPATESSYRFRVEKHVPPPPPPDPETTAKAAFAALPPDAPLEKWLAFLGPDIPEDRWRAIVRRAEERPAEVAALLQSPEDERAEPALEAVSHLTTVDPQVLAAMRKAASELAARIRAFNAMAQEAPGYAEEGNRIRNRFSLWHRAWWTVHRACGVDGRPPLDEILALAEANRDSGHMREVALVARTHRDELPAQ